MAQIEQEQIKQIFFETFEQNDPAGPGHTVVWFNIEGYGFYACSCGLSDIPGFTLKKIEQKETK